jgi:hypothetical protein
VCTEDGTIRLSWRLVHLEPALADYVVAHEVAHLVELNHSKRSGVFSPGSIPTGGAPGISSSSPALPFRSFKVPHENPAHHAARRRLQRSVKFYTEVLGMKLLRTTDRPSRSISLAFVGYDTEDRTAVLELTYNYGVGPIRPRRRLRPRRRRRARRRAGAASACARAAAR